MTNGVIKVHQSRKKLRNYDPSFPVVARDPPTSSSTISASERASLGFATRSFRNRQERRKNVFVGIAWYSSLLYHRARRVDGTRGIIRYINETPIFASHPRLICARGCVCFAVSRYFPTNEFPRVVVKEGRASEKKKNTISRRTEVRAAVSSFIRSLDESTRMRPKKEEPKRKVETAESKINHRP